MKRKLLILIAMGLFALSAAAQQTPRVVHPRIGTSWMGSGLRIMLIDRKQNYEGGEASTRDKDIFSPKSVNIHPSGKKFYVNSLEGGSTVVYAMEGREKLTVIHHSFTTADSLLWAPESGLFAFQHSYPHPETFTGRPVESTFSHGGRYLWIPYYRRSYDLNAQEPSAMAVIDTETDSIIRLFETGPLPKMVATSPDGTLLAVTHWGDNTVGLMDISSAVPADWHYTACLVVDYKLPLHFSTTQKVDRDNNSGYCLRGTVFTPDNRYLLVGCMGGGGGIAVIDLPSRRYLGRILGMKPNLRHLVLGGGHLYASINRDGYVQRIPLQTITDTCDEMAAQEKPVTWSLSGWTSCKVPAGARTISLSPDGRYLFAACNYSSCLAILETEKLTLLGTIPADSFPVGLDVSEDGRYIFTTSQARNAGGNCVDIFQIIRL